MKSFEAIFNDIFPLLKDLFPDINFFKISVQQESFQISHFLAKRAEYLTDENYQIACDSNDSVLVSFVLNQHAVHYDIERPTVKPVATEPETATQALNFFNTLAQENNAKFSPIVLEQDISFGREDSRVRLVNDYDDLKPTKWEYVSQPKPLEDLKGSARKKRSYIHVFVLYSEVVFNN